MTKIVIRHPLRFGSALLLALAISSVATTGQAATADTRLVQAARKGDLPAVRTLIRQRVDVNAAEGDGATALLWAAYRSNVEMARALIAAGANVNAANRFAVTPILQASRIGAAAIVDALLKAGAEAKTVYPNGETALMAAAESGDAEIWSSRPTCSCTTTCSSRLARSPMSRPC